MRKELSTDNGKVFSKNKTSTTKEEKTPTRHHIKKGLSTFRRPLLRLGVSLGLLLQRLPSY